MNDEEGQGESPASDRPRKWEPNRERKVRSKRSFDKKKMDDLVKGSSSIYKGELDPRKKKGKPAHKPRSISRSEQKVLEKAKALAENDPIAQAQRPQKKPTDFRSEFFPCEATPGRLGALYATRDVRQRNGFAQEVIESSIDASKLTPEDRAFATLLTLGVVSTHGTLDEVINRCLDKPTDIKDDVRDAMRIPTYEILFLRKSPHAALDQGVELVRAIAPSASGLGNAVLHRVLKLADSFPFGDPTKDIHALSLLYGYPEWLARLLVTDLGPAEASRLMAISNEPAPVFIAVNAIEATDQEIVDLFEECGCALESVAIGERPIEGCYKVANPRILSDGRIHRLFSQGKILVSDASAQAIAQGVLEDGLPGSLLEIGAGRGTKTILLQSDAVRSFGSQMALTPLDNHRFKIELLEERARTYGVELTDPLVGNGCRLESVVGDRLFDRIFIDSPCSGLGTLRRHHEIRWRLTPEQIDELIATDLALLSSAAAHVPVGGQIIYATCTVTYAENNGVVKEFLGSEAGKGFSLAPIFGKPAFATELTSGGPDAHFAVKFIRRS